ncbi:MAG: acyl transferase [Saprospiraceae bacterium]
MQNTRRGFARFYGDPSDWCVLALLPSYLERGGSSLVAMADHFIQLSEHQQSGFFLYDFDALRRTLDTCIASGTKTLLLGVGHALLDFAEQHPMDLSGVTIMETGGMKGRRREMTRQELHETLCAAFHVPGIHSEYGMTELFSQAYSKPAENDQAARFVPAETLRAVVFELYDPFCPAEPGRAGILCFADLANVDTCSFIATEDIGRVHTDGTFEVLGRLDAAELRGCNLMVSG